MPPRSWSSGPRTVWNAMQYSSVLLLSSNFIEPFCLCGQLSVTASLPLVIQMFILPPYHWKCGLSSVSLFYRTSDDPFSFTSPLTCHAPATLPLASQIYQMPVLPTAYGTMSSRLTVNNCPDYEACAKQSWKLFG